MASRPTIAAIRFGTGLSPHRAAPQPADLLAEIAAPDAMQTAFPAISTRAALDLVVRFSPAKKAGRDRPEDTSLADLKSEINQAVIGAFRATAARWVDAPTGFRERLVMFWADHFTARAKAARFRAVGPAYIEDAIRPHVAGRFADLLKSAITHPLMLAYLDQVASVGPNSKLAQKRKNGAGLNENLAREVMELHTLGVGGGYTQTDVRQFAELLTGLTYTTYDGTVFLPAIAEPGAETLLGHRYGGDPAKLDDVLPALDDLAAHPDTARHIARKLAVHFTSDTPDETLVARLALVFTQTGGDLTAIYTAMLDHPVAWDSFGQKVRQPFDLVLSAVRALGLTGAEIAALPLPVIRQTLYLPIRVMGQTWLEPQGPDGWPEGAEDWITPQGMAGRISWAMRAPGQMLRALPDPRAFVVTALGDASDETVIWAAERAEQRSDGIGLILASPAFNRR